MRKVIGDGLTCPTLFRIENGKIRLLDEVEFRNHAMVRSYDDSESKDYRVSYGFVDFRKEPINGMAVIYPEDMNYILNNGEKFIETLSLAIMRRSEKKAVVGTKKRSYLITEIGNIELRSLFQNVFIYSYINNRFIGKETNGNINFKVFDIEKIVEGHKEERLFFKEGFVVGTNNNICFMLALVSSYFLDKDEIWLKPADYAKSYVVRYAKEVLENNKKW